MRMLVSAFLLFCSSALASGSDNLIPNGGFESGLAGWRPLWCREPGAGSVTLVHEDAHAGTNFARIEHRGDKDWSLEPEVRISVQPGDIFELSGWFKVQGTGGATLCASTWDPQGKNVSWSYGERTIRPAANWMQARTRFVIPPGVTHVQPRVIGSSEALLSVDDIALKRLPGVAALRRGGLPVKLNLTNSSLIIEFETTNATVSVLDRRTGRRWDQRTLAPGLLVTSAQAAEGRIDFGLLDASSGLELRATLALDSAKPEFSLELEGAGELSAPILYPHPFESQPGDYLVVPMNEGISYPVEDETIEPFRLIAYGGHGICMAFWGVTDGEQGHEVIIQTPDDAAIKLNRIDKRLTIAPEWDPQHGQFGYARRLRYVFFDKGGHVAIAKRYREYAKSIGRFKTLAEKRRENPNVDLLAGAVNVWNWDSNPVELVKEMQAAGIRHILWSRGGSPEQLRALNEMGVLTSRYDIYQDVMDPANFPLLRWKHPDWTTAGWPSDIIINANGGWQHGWSVEGKTGGWFDCGVLCDSRALPYARERIPADLATHPYRCRFIDTTTAAPWNECYSTNHPMTRTESREWKMKLLDCVSRENKLVTGSETGHDAAVPFVHYFEGMLSLGPYRVPDAGRDMQRIWEQVPGRVAKFQLGQAYRLPLWELVYHDCVVAQWYWGDYNNKLPALWDKRDLFNVLYGTPPMFMFNRGLWNEQKQRFLQSYKNTCRYVRACAWSEMTDHRFLTPDRNVQQTSFANGAVITVNFGTKPFQLGSGKLVEPMGIDVAGMPQK